jgi:hypothetical protein
MNNFLQDQKTANNPKNRYVNNSRTVNASLCWNLKNKFKFIRIYSITSSLGLKMYYFIRKMLLDDYRQLINIEARYNCKIKYVYFLINCVIDGKVAYILPVITSSGQCKNFTSMFRKRA